MDNYADERDDQLLEADRYTFFVLRRILGETYELLLTDHESLILCLTDPTCPVWIWTPDGASPEKMEEAYRLAAEHSLFREGQRFNVKYELADYLIRREAENGRKLAVSTNLFAYDCPEPVPPAVKADGGICRCAGPDLDEVAEIIEMSIRENGIGGRDAAGRREAAGKYIESGRMFFWKDGQGKVTSSCKYSTTGGLAALSLVYTYPEYRRRHYAQNLVYRVTMAAKEEGFLPMLYTDADYAASNACYEKIGYVLRGRLCTLTAGGLL